MEGPSGPFSFGSEALRAMGNTGGGLGPGPLLMISSTAPPNVRSLGPTLPGPYLREMSGQGGRHPSLSWSRTEAAALWGLNLI